LLLVVDQRLNSFIDYLPEKAVRPRLPLVVKILMGSSRQRVKLLSYHFEVLRKKISRRLADFQVQAKVH
jgi:hypothetical protein